MGPQRGRLTLEPLGHISAVYTQIAERSLLSAARVVGRILAAAERLGDFPHIGHAGLAPGTYEWPVTGLPYILVYDVHERDEEGVIPAVFHGAQDRQRD